MVESEITGVDDERVSRGGCLSEECSCEQRGGGIEVLGGGEEEDERSGMRDDMLYLCTYGWAEMTKLEDRPL
jgi:hypothetical protein